MNNTGIYDDDDNTDDETPSDKETYDKAKETEMDVPTDNNNDNKKLVNTTNENGVCRSTILKAQRTPYVMSMGSERKFK